MEPPIPPVRNGLSSRVFNPAGLSATRSGRKTPVTFLKISCKIIAKSNIQVKQERPAAGFAGQAQTGTYIALQGTIFYTSAAAAAGTAQAYFMAMGLN